MDFPPEVDWRGAESALRKRCIQQISVAEQPKAVKTKSETGDDAPDASAFSQRRLVEKESVAEGVSAES
jgi:hypothetical protein